MSVLERLRFAAPAGNVNFFLSKQCQVATNNNKEYIYYINLTDHLTDLIISHAFWCVFIDNTQYTDHQRDLFLPNGEFKNQ